MGEIEGDLAAKTIISLAECINRGKQGSGVERRLLSLLQDSAIAYSGRANGDATLNDKLIQLGRRRAKKLVHGDNGPPQHEISPSFFGLLEPVKFIKALRNANSRVRFLRHAATSMCGKTTPADAFIIRYTSNVPMGHHWSHAHETGHLSSFEEEKDGKNNIAHETSFNNIDPQTYESNGSAHENTQKNSGSSAEEEGSKPLGKFAVFGRMLNHHGSTKLSDVDMDYSPYASSADSDGDPASESELESEYDLVDDQESDLRVYSYATALPIHVNDLPSPDHPTHHRWRSGALPSSELLACEETETPDANGKFMSWPGSIQIIDAQDPEAYTYYATLGDETEAALFARRQEFEQLSGRPIDLGDLLWCLEHDLIDPATIVRQMRSPQTSKQRKLLKSLGIFTAVAMIYDDLPDMTIDVGVLERPIAETRWARDLLPANGVADFHISPLEQRMVFAIIAYFESGVHDVDPKQLESVIALSAADSLFVSQQVSKPNDPLELSN